MINYKAISGYLPGLLTLSNNRILFIFRRDGGSCSPATDGTRAVKA